MLGPTKLTKLSPPWDTSKLLFYDFFFFATNLSLVTQCFHPPKPAIKRLTNLGKKKITNWISTSLKYFIFHINRIKRMSGQGRHGEVRREDDDDNGDKRCICYMLATVLRTFFF